MKVAWTLARTAEAVRPRNWPTIDQGTVFLVFSSGVAFQESVASNRNGTDTFFEGMMNVAVVDVALFGIPVSDAVRKATSRRTDLSPRLHRSPPPQWLVARLTRTLDRLQPLVPDKTSRCSH